MKKFEEKDGRRKRREGTTSANRGDVSHAKEHILSSQGLDVRVGARTQWRSVLERTGQDGTRENENEGWI